MLVTQMLALADVACNLNIYIKRFYIWALWLLRKVHICTQCVKFNSQACRTLPLSFLTTNCETQETSTLEYININLKKEKNPPVFVTTSCWRLAINAADEITNIYLSSGLRNFIQTGKMPMYRMKSIFSSKYIHGRCWLCFISQIKFCKALESHIFIKMNLERFLGYTSARSI